MARLNSTSPVIVSKEVSVNPAEIAAGATGETEVAVTGIRQGFKVEVEPPAALEAGLVLSHAWASAADEVTIRLANVTGSPVNAAAANWKIVQR